MFPSDNPTVKIPHCANHFGASAAEVEPTLPADQSNVIRINLLEILFKPTLSSQLKHLPGKLRIL